MLRRREFIAGCVTALGVGAVGYAIGIEPFWLETTAVALPLSGALPSLKGLRIVQLSDLHVCHLISESYLKRAFQAVSALNPDIIVYTGDFITAGPDTFERLARLESHYPKAPLGSFGVLGNHDYGQNWSDNDTAEKVIRSLSRSGIQILRNEVVRVRELQIIGIDDFWSARFDPVYAFSKADQRSPGLVLCHNPDGVDSNGWGDFHGWILSGHTHGGQCKPPFLPPPFLPVKNRRYTAGEFDLGNDRRLYINRGLGYLRQARFNVRPEITVFTIT